MMTVSELVRGAKIGLEELNAEQLRAELAESKAVVLVDIRELPEIWGSGTIPGAKHVPRGVLEWLADPGAPYHVDYLQPDARVVVFSYIGDRSAVAAATLRAMGYSDVAHLVVGLEGWINMGGDVVQIAPGESVQS